MAIHITNLEDGEELCYSLPLLIGEITDVPQTLQITVENKTDCSSSVSWPVVESKFKALTHLLPGKNDLLLCCGHCQLSFTLIYKPVVNSKYIRLIYIKCKDDSGCFQAPEKEDNSIASACQRIVLAAQMIQTFTAENLRKHSLGRKTFLLEEDELGNPICHVFTSCLTLKEALELNGEDLWCHFACELMASHLCDGDQCKFLAFLSFTRYCNPTKDVPQNFTDILRLTKGYVALGGGGLALFGTACIHTWAQSVQEVTWRFSNSSCIDRRNLMDDSGNRHFYWACYSTGLGATLHELGHTFDLGHTEDGIMARGFDDMYRFFTVCSLSDMLDDELVQDFQNCSTSQEPVQVDFVTDIVWTPGTKKCKDDILNYDSSAGDLSLSKEKQTWNLPHPLLPQKSPSRKSLENGGAYWARSSAVLLSFHRWLNPEWKKNGESTLTLNGHTLTSTAGIRVIEFRDLMDNAVHHLEFLDGPGAKELTLPLSELSHCLPEGTESVKLVVEDSSGNILKSQIEITL